jgi:hypothetical protein
LIIGQDPSTDEILAHRILVGDAGQKLQRLLNKLGLTRSYVMFNAFLFGIEGGVDQAMQSIELEATILDYRNQLFDKIVSENQLEAILAFGVGAKLAVSNWPGKGNIPVIELVHPSASDSTTLASWNSKMAAAHACITPDFNGQVDLTPYGTTFTPADSVAIPRFDLPFGIPSWQGTNGTRSHRNGPGELIWDAV